MREGRRKSSDRSQAGKGSDFDHTAALTRRLKTAPFIAEQPLQKSLASLQPLPAPAPLPPPAPLYCHPLDGLRLLPSLYSNMAPLSRTGQLLSRIKG